MSLAEFLSDRGESRDARNDLELGLCLLGPDESGRTEQEGEENVMGTHDDDQRLRVCCRVELKLVGRVTADEDFEGEETAVDGEGARRGHVERVLEAKPREFGRRKCQADTGAMP